jgi:hypothetical protein
MELDTRVLKAYLDHFLHATLSALLSSFSRWKV